MPYWAGGRPRSSSPWQARTVRRARIPGRSCSPAWRDRRPPGLPGLAGRLIEGHLATRTWPFGLDYLDAAFNSDLAATLTRCMDSAVAAVARFLPPGSAPPGQQVLAQQLDSLRRTLTVLVAMLVQHGHGPGITAAQAIIASATAPGAGEAALQAGRAAAIGLATGDPGQWSSLAGQLDAAPGLLREVLCDLARDPGPLMDRLTEGELGELWELLARYWPYQAGGTSGFVGFVGPSRRGTGETAS